MDCLMILLIISAIVGAVIAICGFVAGYTYFYLVFYKNTGKRESGQFEDSHVPVKRPAPPKPGES